MPIFHNGEEQEYPRENSQLNLANIRLDRESPRRWYRSSLFLSQKYYLVYRGFLAAYFIAWFSSQVALKQIAGENPKHFIYFTTWAETTLNFHLMASFLVCLYGYIYDNDDEVSGFDDSECIVK